MRLLALLAVAATVSADMRDQIKPMMMVSGVGHPRPPRTALRSRTPNEAGFQTEPPVMDVCVRPRAPQCTACERVVGHVAPFVNRFVLKERLWSKTLAREIMDRMSKHSCSDTELFAKNSGALLDGCIDFMSEHYKTCRDGFRRRLHPRYDEYGEDIVPAAFCKEIGACQDTPEASLDRSMTKATQIDAHRKHMREL